MPKCPALEHDEKFVVTMYTLDKRAVEVCKRCMITIGDPQMVVLKKNKTPLLGIKNIFPDWTEI